MIQTREEATQQQVGTILSAMHLLRSFLLVDAQEFETPPRLNGEASLAANASFINACARLDKVLLDDARWAEPPYTKIHESLIDLHKAQQKHVEAQTALLENHRRPSHVFKPQFIALDTHFLCYWGDIQTGNAIIGRGDTPEQALVDFDNAFRRTPQETLEKIQQNRPKIDNGPVTPEDFFKKNQQNPPNEQQ